MCVCVNEFWGKTLYPDEKSKLLFPNDIWVQKVVGNLVVWLVLCTLLACRLLLFNLSV